MRTSGGSKRNADKVKEWICRRQLGSKLLCLRTLERSALTLLLLLRRRAFLVTPVERADDEEVDENADRQEDKKEDDKPS